MQKLGKGWVPVKLVVSIGGAYLAGLAGLFGRLARSTSKRVFPGKGRCHPTLRRRLI